MAYTDWDLLEAVKTEIQSITGVPSVVRIVPKGKERNRPVDGIVDWVNLSVQKSNVVWEVNSSYITTSTIRVTICTESFKELCDAQEALILNVALIKNELTRSVLGGLVRKNPKDLGNNYVDADNSALFYAQFDLEYEVQNEENPSVDILTWREQTDADITVTVEGLDTDEYQFRKANGEVGTSGTEYAGASTGTGKIRVLDSADLTKLERVQLDVKGPEAPSKTVPDCDGLTEAAATAAITAAGLTPDSDGAFSATTAKGLVISQSPAAGTAAYAGDIVTITVSFGPEYTVVPVTKDSTPEAAAAALVAAGLVVGTSTSEMTNDTAAGLVSASSPAAGTGVAAGSTVDLTVSLGDRRVEIPFLCTPRVPIVITAIPNTVYQWRLPDGTFQRADSPTYTASGAGEYVWIVMDAGKTVADLARIYSSGDSTNYPTHTIDVEDLKYARPSNSSSGFRFQHSWCRGDLATLSSDVFATLGTVSWIMFGPNVGGAVVPLVNYELYGSVSGWVILALRLYLQNMRQVTGAVNFAAGATTTHVLYDNSTGFSYADIAQTIINWDNCNAGVFARTGNFNQYKRSLIGAANPAAEAAITSLEAKGCTFTFLAE